MSILLHCQNTPCPGWPHDVPTEYNSFDLAQVLVKRCLSGAAMESHACLEALLALLSNSWQECHAFVHGPQVHTLCDVIITADLNNDEAPHALDVLLLCARTLSDKQASPGSCIYLMLFVRYCCICRFCHSAMYTLSLATLWMIEPIGWLKWLRLPIEMIEPINAALVHEASTKYAVYKS